MEQNPYRYSSISITMIKQMEYCPAIPWILAKTGWAEPPTDSMKIAKEEANAYYKEEIAEKLGLQKPWRIEACLRDRETGLGGCIDIIAGSKRVTVVEVKLYRRRWRGHIRVQLIAYAYLANKLIAPVERAILVEEGDVVMDIPIAREHLEAIEKKIERLRRIIEEENPPAANPSERQCYACQYRRVCPLAAI